MVSNGWPPFFSISAKMPYLSFARAFFNCLSAVCNSSCVKAGICAQWLVACSTWCALSGDVVVCLVAVVDVGVFVGVLLCAVNLYRLS